MNLIIKINILIKSEKRFFFYGKKGDQSNVIPNETEHLREYSFISMTHFLQFEYLRPSFLSVSTQTNFGHTINLVFIKTILR